MAELLGELRRFYGDEVDRLLSPARELDRHYVPSRYPNVQATQAYTMARSLPVGLLSM